MPHHIGIYPGTFDPLHDGHVAFANETLRVCQLDAIYFLPEATPRNKPQVTPVDDRIKYIEQQLRSYKNLHVQKLVSSSFTIDQTLPEILQHFPDAKLTLLLGSDVALHLVDWPNITQLLAACNLAIGLRSSHNANDIAKNIATLPRAPHYTLITTNYAHISSSQLRD